jgi:hypothetical protein
MALTYGELTSITEKMFIPKLVDNIFDSNAFLAKLKAKAYEKGSGERAIQPLAYATTTAAGRFSGSDTLDTTPNDQITAAEYLWKQYYANITVTRIDELKNSGPEAVINFVKAKVQLAEKSLASLLGTDLLSDGSTTNSIQGLKLAAATSGTHGGIAKASYSWWQGNVDSTTTAVTYPTLRDMMGLCTIDNDMPDMIVTTQAIYSDIVSLFQPQQRFTDSKTADAGFKNIMFEGTPVVIDSHCPSGYIFFVNTKYLTLYWLEDFRFDPFLRVTNQAVTTAKIFWTGALAASNNRMLGMMSAIA